MHQLDTGVKANRMALGFIRERDAWVKGPSGGIGQRVMPWFE